MALKDTWKDLIDGESEISSDNINAIADAVIDLEKNSSGGSLSGDYVTFTDYASADKAGVVKMKDSPFESGLQITRDGTIQIFEAIEDDLGVAYSAVITTKILDKAVKFVGDGYYATAEEVGDISSAFDELHAYAEALIGGAE